MRRIVFFYVLILSVFFKANTLNVLNFGANGSDNQDDTAAFQKCLDQLAKLGGGVMHIPYGNYHISHLKFFGRQYSNITIAGNNATIHQLLPKNRTYTSDRKWLTFAERKAADGCFVFDAMVTYQKNDQYSIKNIKIKDLNFRSDVVRYKFDELLHQISAHGVSDFLVENCTFTGFLGDAIAINASTDYKINRNAYNKDIKIIKSKFDGLNQDNRQAISIYYADGFLIEDCSFKNTTRSDMPGAIDIEPNDDLQVVRNGIIRNCTFENIGGLGAICFVLQNSTAKNSFSNNNFLVENCTFSKVVSPLTVIGPSNYQNYSGPGLVTFKNSTVKNTQVAASLIRTSQIKFSNIKYDNITSENLNVVPQDGAAHITFENCLFNKVANQNGLAFTGITFGIDFINCTFQNFNINAITINDPSGIGTIRNNHFKSTAYKGGKPLVTSFYNKEKKLQHSISKNKISGNFTNLDLSVFKR